jgi:hypothetical protein
MPDASLCLLLEEVRGKTLRILRAVPPEHALWAPPGLQNHITWHAGHCHFVVEWLTMAPLGRPPRPRGAGPSCSPGGVAPTSCRRTAGRPSPRSSTGLRTSGID